MHLVRPSSSSRNICGGRDSLWPGRLRVPITPFARSQSISQRVIDRMLHHTLLVDRHLGLGFRKTYQTGYKTFHRGELGCHHLSPSACHHPAHSKTSPSSSLVLSSLTPYTQLEFHPCKLLQNALYYHHHGCLGHPCLRRRRRCPCSWYVSWSIFWSTCTHMHFSASFRQSITMQTTLSTATISIISIITPTPSVVVPDVQRLSTQQSNKDDSTITTSPRTKNVS
jgi:hypothetical protein